MKKGKRRLLYLLLLIAVICLVLVLALPTLIRANIASRLDAAGLRLEQLELAAPGLAETHIRSARIAGDDGSRYDIDNLVATYSLDGLMMGRLEQVTARLLRIQPSTQTQPLTELLQALFGLMEQDLNSAIPVDRLHLDRIRIALGNKRQLDASLAMQKTGRELVAEMRFETPDKPLLRFSQQQAGRWLLEASNHEEDAFAAALYDRSKKQPLVLSVESDLARIRQWMTLFGIPFPAHNAVTHGTLRLKPDFTKREAVFAIDGTATGIDEPGLRIASADTAIEGRLQWHDDSPDIDITGNAELTMEQLRRPELQADRLLFKATGLLTITQQGLSGRFTPGTLIESEQFALGTIETGKVSLVTTVEQQFGWERTSGTWRFGECRYRAQLDSGGLPPFGLENGGYALSHEPWRFPLEGRTGFTLEGSSGQAGDGMLLLRDLQHSLSGSIAWPAAKQDLTLTLQLDATASEMQAASLAATQLSARGGLSLVLAKGATTVAIEPDFRLAAAAISDDRIAVEAARLVMADPFSLQLTENGVELSPEKHSPLSVTLSGGKIGSNGSAAESVSIALDGRLEAPAPGTLHVAGKLRLRAANLVHGASRAASLEAQGGIRLVHEADNFLSARLEPGFSARLASLRSHDLAMEQAEIRTQQALPLLSPEGSALAGSYRIDHSALTHPGFRLEPGSASLDIDTDADDEAMTGRLVAESQIIRIDGQAWNAAGHAADFVLSPSNLTIEGSLTLGNTGSDISYGLDQDLQEEKGELKFTSKSQGVQALWGALVRLGLPVPRELQLLSGSASATGTATWSDKLESARADIRLNNTGGRYGEAWFSGLSGSFDLALYPEFEGSSRNFSIPVIDLGIPVTNLKSRVTFSKAADRQAVITLNNLRAAMFDGTLSASRIRLDLNRRSNSFTLAFRDVSLAEMVRLQQFEEIDATGRLSGTLPITIGPSGVSISNGKASADAAGGYVRYRPKDAGAAMRSASMETEMLLKALDDYQYTELEAGAAYRPDGQLTLQLQMKGRSPGLHETRPLHLNLNLDQNILSLIKSLRAVNGLNDRIDRAVKQHFKARNR